MSDACFGGYWLRLDSGMFRARTDASSVSFTGPGTNLYTARCSMESTAIADSSIFLMSGYTRDCQLRQSRSPVLIDAGCGIRGWATRT